MDNLSKFLESMNYRYESPDQAIGLGIDTKISQVATNIKDIEVLERIRMIASMSDEICAPIITMQIEQLKNMEQSKGFNR